MILSSSIAIFSTLPSAKAETVIPKLPVSEFTLKFEAHPYDVPPTYAIDRYTGKNAITNTGCHVENKSIVVTIKGITVNTQAFTDYLNGTDFWLSYNVRVKGHFEEGWTELSNLAHSLQTIFDYIITIPVEYPLEAQVDFQVQTVVEYNTWVFVSDNPFHQ